MNNYPTIDKAATGNRIRTLRKENHIKVDDIVSFMGFESQQAVYKWQHGKSLPTVDNLLALSFLLGVTIEKILVYTIPNNKEQQAKTCCSVFLFSRLDC